MWAAAGGPAAGRTGGASRSAAGATRRRRAPAAARGRPARPRRGRAPPPPGGSCPSAAPADWLAAGRPSRRRAGRAGTAAAAAPDVPAAAARRGCRRASAGGWAGRGAAKATRKQTDLLRPLCFCLSVCGVFFCCSMMGETTVLCARGSRTPPGAGRCAWCRRVGQSRSEMARFQVHGHHSRFLPDTQQACQRFTLQDWRYSLFARPG